MRYQVFFLTILSLCFCCFILQASPMISYPDKASLVTFRSIYLNLRLYYDEELLTRFYANYNALNQFLLALVHSAWLSYNSPVMTNFGYSWHFIVQTIELMPAWKVTINSDQDGDAYRQAFFRFYESELENETYSAMILFSGLNWRHQSNRTDTLGLTVPDTACRSDGDRSIIVEARHYQAAFVLAHELGHSVGLYHDEDPGYGCGSSYIMSATTGHGKTRFSPCSAVKLKRHFEQLFKSTKPRTMTRVECLQYDSYPRPVAIFSSSNPPAGEPFRSVSVDVQCKTCLGDGFTAKESNNSAVNVCARVGCTNALVNIYIHPAIENTTCDLMKFCRAGRCRAKAD